MKARRCINSRTMVSHHSYRRLIAESGKVVVRTQQDGAKIAITANLHRKIRQTTMIA